MVLPFSNEGLSILPNKAGERTVKISELQAALLPNLIVNDSPSLIDISLQTADVEFTIGKTTTSADITDAQLDLFPDDSLVNLRGTILVQAGAGVTSATISVAAGETNNPFVRLTSPLSNTEQLGVDGHIFTPMKDGLIQCLWKATGIGGSLGIPLQAGFTPLWGISAIIPD